MSHSPPQPPPIIRIQAVTSTDQQQSHEIDVPETEVLVEVGGLPRVIEMAEPIDDLTESVFEPRRPFFRRFLTDFSKDGIEFPAFEFDEAELLFASPQDDIGGIVAIDLKFERHLLGDTEVPECRAEERGKMQRRFEQALDLTLAQARLGIQQSAELSEFDFELGGIESDWGEFFRHHAAPTSIPPVERIVSLVAISMTLTVFVI